MERGASLNCQNEEQAMDRWRQCAKTWQALLVLSLASAALASASESTVRTLEGHKGSVLAVAFSPDGKVLATSSRDKTIKLWDPRTGKLERTLMEHTADVYCVIFSPKGDMLASASGDKTVKLWD